MKSIFKVFRNFYLLLFVTKYCNGVPTNREFEQTHIIQHEEARPHYLPDQSYQQPILGQSDQHPIPVQTHQQAMPVQQYQRSVPVQTHQQQRPEQPHQQSMQVWPHQQSKTKQIYQPQIAYPLKQPITNFKQEYVPTQNQRQNASFPYQANDASHQYYSPAVPTKQQEYSPQYQNQNSNYKQPVQSPPQQHQEQNPATQYKQPQHAPIPPSIPKHHQNKLSQQHSQPSYGYNSELNRVYENIDSVPIPYMKYEKDESPVLHHGHDGLDSELGDRKAALGEFPYFVQIRTNNEHVCGGSLIRSPVTGRQVVLTAMHCLVVPYTSKLLLPHQITLRMGIVGVNDEGQERKAVAILTHPDYTLVGPNKWPVNDIGMVLLNFEFNLNDHVKFIDLPEENLPTLWHGIQIKGFGKGREAGHMDVTKHMRTLSVPVWDNDACNKAYYEESGYHVITEGHFCAAHRTGGLDSCQGDSGGPATTKEKGKLYLVGIVSWGKGCAKIAYPGVYVRTYAYLKWIKKTLYDYEVNDILPPHPKYPQ